jgi:hypothetical protein
MRTIVQHTVLFITVFFLSGCLHVNTKLPLDQSMHETPIGSKVGKAECHVVLWAVGWDDCGTHGAAQNGGITAIHDADSHTLLALFTAINVPAVQTFLIAATALLAATRRMVRFSLPRFVRS